MSRYAEVAIEAAVDTTYHYRVPDHLSASLVPGARVLVPLRNRPVRGICVRLQDDCPIDPAKLKDIARVAPAEEAVPADLLELTRWIAGYYATGWGTVLAAAIPAAVRKDQGARIPLRVRLIVATEDALAAAERVERKAPRQAAVLRYLAEIDKPVPVGDLESATGATRPVLHRLAEMNLLVVEEEAAALAGQAAPDALELSPTQTEATRRICAAVSEGAFRTFLLHGVTGSGKTEVYLRAMRHTMSLGRSVLVLVPEISLTPQTVERFRQRAGRVAVLHSHMADGDRARMWREIRSGGVSVVVGTRSAIFAPLDRIGLIVVDEEHERSFKQETAPRYHARDVAVVRAQQAGAVIVLGSATPSLETWHNARDGKYELLSLPERAGGARPASVHVVDMRREWADLKRPVTISRALERALVKTLLQKEQAILFLNRRGFNTFAQCRACGEVVKCEACDIAMTYHRRQHILRCHYCDATLIPPETCPLCSAPGLRFGGTGTERIENILEQIVPDARVLRMDSDTMTGRDVHAQALDAFGAGEYDILVGTQMVTKGFDFPNVTLVGVLAADSAINLPDFRAAERAFQLVAQVIGRAGRRDKPGRAVVQAFQPEHAAIQSAISSDVAGFLEQEAAERRPMRYPPFGRLARIVGRGRDEAELTQVLTEAADALRSAAPRPLSVLGPAPCAVTRTHGEYRYHIMVKADTPKALHHMLSSAREALADRRGARIVVDIDPLSML